MDLDPHAVPSARPAAGLKDVRVRSLAGIARVFAVAFTDRA
ncbi:hypothetical protein [Anaeromyxobacter dehalogenans]|nr:hypothetical protein [Anaeromyxobacter dehalogenans]